MALRPKVSGTLSSFSAYHGGSWRARKKTHQMECESRSTWPFQGVDSEYMKLKEILLFIPPKTTPSIAVPEKVQHLAPLDWKKLKRESSALKRALESNGVTVRLLDGGWFPDTKPNLMFVRDLFFMTPWGAVLGRMASEVRAGEELWAQYALAKAGVPLLQMIRGRGTFEGADALWLSARTVLVGVGNRTNAEGFRQLKTILREFKVKAVPVRLPRSVQHLLGMLQIVGPKTVLLRSTLAQPGLIRKLRAFGYKKIIQIPEIDEVTQKQGMNILTVAPQQILMPKGCPQLKRLLTAHRIKIIAELPIEQFINAAGGIACATNALSRSLCKAPL